MKCIGGVVNDVSSEMLSHNKGKTFGELFEEKKSELDNLQKSLSGMLMPAFPPMPAVKYTDFGLGVDLHPCVLPTSPLFPVPNLSMVYDIMGIIFGAIATCLPPMPEPPPAKQGEEPASLTLGQTIAAVGIALVKGMAPSVKVNGYWVGNAGTSLR